MSTGGKGSGRRPGLIPPGRWEEIFGKKKPAPAPTENQPVAPEQAK
jgi:hypothetical protein